MKTSLLIACAALFVAISCNYKSVESLGKYSYRIHGSEGASLEGATAFFIRDSNSIYLVTAKHVVAGCENRKTKYLTFPDILYIYTKERDKPIEINTRNTKATLPCDEIDVYFIKMDTVGMSTINSVEKFFHPRYEDPKAVEIHGYPLQLYSKDEVMDLLTPAYPLIIPSKTYTFFGLRDSTGKEDTGAVIIAGKTSVRSGLMGGFSGSPVFIMNREQTQWRLAGLFSAAGDSGNDTANIVIVPFEAIMKEMNRNR